MFLQYPPSCALDRGYSRPEAKREDFSSYNPVAVREEADEFFVKAYESLEPLEQRGFYGAAMKKYYILSQIYPADYYAFTQMARIQDNLLIDKLAKKNYYIAQNLDRYNPYTNFYMGEFHYKREMYYKALNYYLIAYNNGYGENYVTILKLAQLYEKLGDLKKAKEFYQKANSINSTVADLDGKIKSLENSGYDKSEYYHFIRE